MHNTQYTVPVTVFLKMNPRVRNILTPRCRVLPEKLTGLQLVKKFPAFHGTRRFITVLTSARHLSLSWTSSLHGVKRSGRETDPSPPSSAQVNECSYTALSRHRQNTITFTLEASKTLPSVCNLCTASESRPLTRARTPIAVPPLFAGPGVTAPSLWSV